MRARLSMSVSLALAATPCTAAANGLTTHLWICEEALAALPDGGLRDLLASDDGRLGMRNGAVFPDGGYAVGDDYGEIAHWEPFHAAYLDWLLGAFPDPLDPAAARHVGFLFGMACHGMADQVHDALYLERAYVYDAASDWGAHSVDEADDVAFAARVGPQEVPEEWVPYEELAAIFASAAGHPVDVETLEQGRALVGVAVAYVGVASQEPDAVARYEGQFPWATTHLAEEPPVPGSPAHEAEVMVAFWVELFDRLLGEDRLDPAVIATVPASGAYGHATDAASVEAWVSFVMARALDEATLSPGAVRVVPAAGGAAHPISLRLYYGHGSHVVHVLPAEDWAAETDYAVTVSPGPTTIDGLGLDSDVTFAFSTRAAPPVEEEAETPAGCGCDGTGRAARTGALVASGLAAALGARRWRPRRDRPLGSRSTLG